jgi:sensor histidine kinase YesM
MAVVSGAFSKALTTPLFKLQHAMRKAETGNYGVRIQLSGKDEFGRLGGHFNRMLQELDVLQQEVLNTRLREFQQQLHRKDSELIALRAQINPHFLYNTLNTMTCIGEVHNVQEVALLSSSLAHMFQYGISGEHFATLREEMEQVNAYLAIMRTRYLDRFEMNVSIPAYTLEVRVLKMMLQPLVENAFQYGLERKPHGRIDIIAVIREEELVVTVMDDGAGMDEATLAKLKALLDPLRLSEKIATDHIGLYNVQKRLQLHYEGRAYLDIASEQDRGTVVTIHIPYKREERHEEAHPDVPTDDRG